MRLFVLVVLFLIFAIGVWMIAVGVSSGWGLVAVFGVWLLMAILEPWLPKPRVACEWRLLITKDGLVCEHSQGLRESIRWMEVNRIWYITTSDGPWLADHWLRFEGENKSCSIPTEAIGFNGIWEELKQRFAGFDYEPLIDGGTDDARYLCWEHRQ